jgi:hypothetical protein
VNGTQLSKLRVSTEADNTKDPLADGAIMLPALLVIMPAEAVLFTIE